MMPAARSRYRGSAHADSVPPNWESVQPCLWYESNRSVQKPFPSKARPDDQRQARAGDECIQDQRGRHKYASIAWLTAALTGRGERMRASGPVERVVRQRLI